MDNRIIIKCVREKDRQRYQELTWRGAGAVGGGSLEVMFAGRAEGVMKALACRSPSCTSRFLPVKQGL